MTEWERAFSHTFSLCILYELSSVDLILLLHESTITDIITVIITIERCVEVTSHGELRRGKEVRDQQSLFADWSAITNASTIKHQIVRSSNTTPPPTWQLIGVWCVDSKSGSATSFLFSNSNRFRRASNTNTNLFSQSSSILVLLQIQPCQSRSEIAFRWSKLRRCFFFIGQ